MRCSTRFLCRTWWLDRIRDTSHTTVRISRSISFPHLSCAFALIFALLLVAFSRVALSSAFADAPVESVSRTGTLSEYAEVPCTAAPKSNRDVRQTCFRSKKNATLQGFTLSRSSGTFFWSFNCQNFTSEELSAPNAVAHISVNHRGRGGVEVLVRSVASRRVLAKVLDDVGPVARSTQIEIKEPYFLEVTASGPWSLLIGS